ncbi:MAG TPA: LytTR family DNA-binding domain-containing protein [Edaphocola sp.]|nr:LytTR family DNA-binding domain-containing protein [Edaphocola sp.]
MNIVIIEDEILTAEDLKETILDLMPAANILKIIKTVKEAKQYFSVPVDIDLIFCDIQLGDGLSFEIFRHAQPPAPIVFCTAFDEYALEAFETNGIHYILKPFDESKIADALNKFQSLKSSFKSPDNTFEKVKNLLEQQRSKQDSSILVFFQDKVIPVKINNVALFFIKNEVSHLLTFEGNLYYINKSLDEIQQLCGDDFYRANRQFIINRNAIKEMEHSQSRKISVSLNVPFNESILVSKEKMANFLEWLKN